MKALRTVKEELKGKVSARYVDVRVANTHKLIWQNRTPEEVIAKYGDFKCIWCLTDNCGDYEVLIKLPEDLGKNSIVTL